MVLVLVHQRGPEMIELIAYICLYVWVAMATSALFLMVCDRLEVHTSVRNIVVTGITWPIFWLWATIMMIKEWKVFIHLLRNLK